MVLHVNKCSVCSLMNKAVRWYLYVSKAMWNSLSGSACPTLCRLLDVGQYFRMVNGTEKWFFIWKRKQQRMKLVFQQRVPTFRELCGEFLSVCDSDLQRWADSDDLVALCSINLQQHWNGLLQHRTSDVVETATRFIYSDVGDLAVSSGNYGFKDASAILNRYSHIISFTYKRDTSTGSPVSTTRY